MSAGDVIVNEGAEEHTFKVEEVFLGVGAPVTKSVLLELLSVQPLFNLIPEVVLDNAGTAPEPSNALAVAATEVTRD